jgi:hypothetical protein
MKVYLTSTPEFSLDVLNEVALILNQTPGELEFISSKPLTARQYGLTYPKMNSIESIKCLTFDEFFGLCAKHRIDRDIPDDAYVVLVTSIKNDLNWFSAFRSNNIFIHGKEWEYYTKRDSKFGIAYQTLENIFQSQIRLNIDDIEKEPNIHMKSIGCINDMCINKTEILLKLRTADICDACINRAENENVDTLILDHISRIIRSIREEFVNSFRITSMVKPDNVYIDAERTVKIGKKNVKLDALNRVLFIFFLKNLEGVKTKLLFEREKDLYSIYKEIKDDPDEMSIKKLVKPVGGTFETVRSRLNSALVNQLGPKLAEFYILIKVEIKDDHNKIKINLEEEYITIEPPKRK